MNQSELAKKLGISRQRVSQLIKGGATKESLLSRVVQTKSRFVPSFETRSVSKMAQEIGISRDTLSSRLRLGLYGRRQHAIWLSFDVKATGPTAGSHVILSLGVVAYDGMTFEEVDSWEANLSREYHVTGMTCAWDDDTLRWWENPERENAYKITTSNPQDPKVAIPNLVKWLKMLRKKCDNWPIIWAAWPATLDMPFVSLYCHMFARTAWERLCKDNPMQCVAAFDIKSYMLASMQIEYHGDVEHDLPARWTAENPMPHVAINDARAQGQMLMRMLWETPSKV